MTVEIEVPEALRDLGLSAEEIRREVPTLLVLKKFREHAISTGKAAELLGLNRYEFLELLGREKIPVFDLTEEELKQEFAMAEYLAKNK